MDTDKPDKPPKPPVFPTPRRLELPDDYFETMTGLSFISKININEKISVPDKGEPCVSRDTIVTSIFRRFFGESRQETLKFVEQVYRNASSIAEEFAERGDVERLGMVKNAFEKTAEGIENLCKTYEDDKHFTSRLHVLFDEYYVRLGNVVSAGA